MGAVLLLLMVSKKGGREGVSGRVKHVIVSGQTHVRMKKANTR